MLNAIFTDTTTASVSIAAPTTETLTTGSTSITISTDVYPGGYVITLVAISLIRICTLIIFSYYIIQFHSRKH